MEEKDQAPAALSQPPATEAVAVAAADPTQLKTEPQPSPAAEQQTAFTPAAGGPDDESAPLPAKLPGGQRHDSMFNPRKLFIGGVGQDVTQSEFRAFWDKYGELEDCIVISDALTGKNRGFGFVVFKEKAHTDQVLAEAGSLEMNGRRLDIKKAVPRTPRKARGGYHHQAQGRYRTTEYGRAHPNGPHANGWHGPWGGPRHDPYYHPPADAHYDVRYTPGYDGSSDPRSGGRNGGPVSFGRRGLHPGRPRLSTQGKLFVGQLPEDISKQELGDYFSKFGELSDYVVMFDSAKRSRRFGFVTFADPSVADSVLQSGPHYIPSSRPPEAPLVVERATPRGEKTREYPPFPHPNGGNSWHSYPTGRYGPPPAYPDRPYDPYYGPEPDWYGGYGRPVYPPAPPADGYSQYPPQSGGYGPVRPPQQQVAYHPY